MAVETHRTIDELMHAHRAAWAAAVLGDDTDAMWVEDYTPASRQDVVDAARRGAKLVVAVPAHTSDADDLARAIPGATVVPQFPAGGSLIGAGRSAQVEADEEVAPEHAAWLLVCANVDTAEAEARVGVMAGGALAAHLARLEEALEALREANVRLAREKLGHHDAAAGTLVGRAEQRAVIAEREMAEWKHRFEYEQALAIKHHDWFLSARSKLDEPHHRAAERVYKVVRRVPGARALLSRRSG